MFVILFAVLWGSPVLAQRGRCAPLDEPGRRLEIGEPVGAPTHAVSRPEARRLVRSFRARFRSVSLDGVPSDGRPMLRALLRCMSASHGWFMVRRVAVADVRARLDWMRAHDLDAYILAETPDAMPNDWVWEVQWGGQLTGHVPAGPFSGFLTQDGETLLAAVHWPEG